MDAEIARQQLAKGKLHVEEKPKGRFLAFAVTLIVMGLLALIFTLIVIMPKITQEPDVIVEVIAPEVQATPQMQKRNAMKGFEKSFTMPTQSAFARMMKASSKPIKAPSTLLDKLDLDLDAPAGLGDSDAKSDPDKPKKTPGELTSGASFFGIGTNAKRIVYVIDCSKGAADHRSLMARELERSINALPPDVQFAVICYGPVPWRLGQDAVPQLSKDKTTFTVSRRDDSRLVFEKTEVMISGFKFNDFIFGRLPTSLAGGKWTRATPGIGAKVRKDLTDQPSLQGNFWESALYMAHNLKPSPEAIYFIVGGGRGVPRSVRQMRSYNRDHGRPAILGICMQTSRGIRELHGMSLASGGQTRIILDPNGKSESAKNFLLNPGNHMRFLGEFDDWITWEKERKLRGVK